MAKSSIQKEMDAIKTVTQAFEALDENARQRVLDYAVDHLGLARREATAVGGVAQRAASAAGASAGPAEREIVDIRSLREEKKPSSDVEMTALVAYYLYELAPKNLRKDAIGTTDVTEFFKQAGHPLPAQPRYTLANARMAGYLDSVGQGKYRLNPVGYNLVAHNLPRSGEIEAPRAKRRGRKRTSRKSAQRKPKKQKKAGRPT